MVQKLLFRGLVAGLIAGLVAAVLQMTFVVPVLMEAELYETGALTHFGGASDAGAAHDHDHGAESDVQRTLMTWLAVTATFMGWGLIMAAASRASGPCGWLATGIAGQCSGGSVNTPALVGFGGSRQRNRTCSHCLWPWRHRTHRRTFDPARASPNWRAPSKHMDRASPPRTSGRICSARFSDQRLCMGNFRRRLGRID